MVFYNAPKNVICKNKVDYIYYQISFYLCPVSVLFMKYGLYDPYFFNGKYSLDHNLYLKIMLSSMKYHWHCISNLLGLPFNSFFFQICRQNRAARKLQI